MRRRLLDRSAHGLRYGACSAALRDPFRLFAQAFLRAGNKCRATDSPQYRFTMRLLTSFINGAAKLMSRPTRRSKIRNYVSICLACTGASYSTDFNSSTTRSSTNWPTRKPSSNTSPSKVNVTPMLTPDHFIHGFQQSRPKLRVDMEAGIYDAPRQSVQSSFMSSCFPNESTFFQFDTSLRLCASARASTQLGKIARNSVASPGFILPASTSRNCRRRKAPAKRSFSSAVTGITSGTCAGFPSGPMATKV